jgi:glycogen operon protein
MHSVQSFYPAVALSAVVLCCDVTSAADIETAPPLTFKYGAHKSQDGWVEFGLRAPPADTAELLLYDAPGARTPWVTVPMTQNRTGDWGVRIRGPDVGTGTLYMYRLTGHGTATAGAPFGTVLNGNFVLNDPYAYRTQEVGYPKLFLSTPFVDTDYSIYAGGGKSVVYDHSADPAASHVYVPSQDLIVYELHVQDYTAQLQELPLQLRGTYLGLAQHGLKTPGGLKAGIDHLDELGVTAVELIASHAIRQGDGRSRGAGKPLGVYDHELLRPRIALRVAAG